MGAFKRRIPIATALLVGVSVPLFAAAAPTQAANPGSRARNLVLAGRTDAAGVPAREA
jgi:hypothetical protein